MPTPYVQDMEINEGSNAVWFWDGCCLVSTYKPGSHEPQAVKLLRGRRSVAQYDFRWWKNIGGRKRGEDALAIINPYLDSAHAWIKAQAELNHR